MNKTEPSRDKVGRKLTDRRASEHDRTIARRLRDARVSRGLSMQTLATRVDCSYQQIQKYEAGLDRLPAGRTYLMARALGVDVSLLFDPAQALPEGEAIEHADMSAVRAYRALPPGLALAISNFIVALHVADRCATSGKA